MKGKPTLPTFDQLLDAIPTCNRAVRVEPRGDALILWVPIRRRIWMTGLAWVFPFRKEKGIALDTVGALVWSACDGRRRVEEIVEGFAERHQLRFHEARLSVSHFLKSLVERNLLVLAVPAASCPSSVPGLPAPPTAEGRLEAP
jgi:hypothetical protein